MAEEKVADVLQNLPRVESTSDFELKVRSRIANSKVTPQRTWLIPTVSFASLLVLITVGIAFWTPANPGDLAVTELPIEVIDTTPKSPFAETRRVNELPNVFVPANTSITAPEVAAKSTRNSKRSQTVNRPVSRPGSIDDGRGYVDRTVTPAQTINANVGSSAPVLLKNYFPMIGVDAAFENNVWIVRKVTPDSVADRTGVRSGDIVESIGSVRLDERTGLDESTLDNKITVRRGSEIKTLESRKP